MDHFDLQRGGEPKHSSATQGLDTTTPAGKAMFQMMGVFAEFERAMIQERFRHAKTS